MTERESDFNAGTGRRRFLRTAAAGALAALSGGGLRALAGPPAEEAPRKLPWMEEPKGPYAPFRMTLQSYTLRKFDFEKAAETLFDLHLRYVEIWPGHLASDVSDMDLKKSLKVLRHNMVWKIAYGVVDFTRDHEKNRALFEFAKEKLRLYCLTADPSPDSFDSLDKLVEEYKIPVAIHNHGPEDDRYRTPDMVEKAIKDHHKLIGVCVDTGHYLLADVDPVEAVKRFMDRVYAVHLKDVKGEGKRKEYCILGRGDLKVVELLRELKAAGFKGGLALEYEEEEDDPVASVKKCLEAVQDAVKKVNS